jgi:hypothetical protein
MTAPTPPFLAYLRAQDPDLAPAGCMPSAGKAGLHAPEFQGLVGSFRLLMSRSIISTGIGISTTVFEGGIVHVRRRWNHLSSHLVVIKRLALRYSAIEAYVEASAAGDSLAIRRHACEG